LQERYDVVEACDGWTLSKLDRCEPDFAIIDS
jgi:hypothetical protein